MATTEQTANLDHKRQASSDEEEHGEVIKRIKLVHDRLPKSRSKMNLRLQELNEVGTPEYRVLPVDDTGRTLSLWHDVPLLGDDPTNTFHFICEIPKCTRKKYEIATKEAANPIKQDEKSGKLREFSKGDIYFNYGCFPRTWEDPKFIHPDLEKEGVGGDNDPLDVCEIGLRPIKTGEVRSVKVLGILCMIDDGEADWKVIAIDAEDRWAPELNDIQDVEELLPGILPSIREWFRTYKVPDGKPPNVFGLNEQFMDRKYALEVIAETHHAWHYLMGHGAEQEELVLSDQYRHFTHSEDLPAKDDEKKSATEESTIEF